MRGRLSVQRVAHRAGLEELAMGLEAEMCCSPISADQ
jgi:hypothetical protein